MALKIDANFEGKLTGASKNDMRIFTRAYKSLRTGTLMVFFFSNQRMNELRIYRGVMCHDNEK